MEDAKRVATTDQDRREDRDGVLKSATRRIVESRPRQPPPARGDLSTDTATQTASGARPREGLPAGPDLRADAATQTATPAASPPISSTARGREPATATGTTSLVTARETMGLQEVHRTRAWLRVSIAICVVQAVALQLLGGDPSAKRVLLGSLLFAFVACCGTLYWFRRDEVYSVRRFIFALYASIAAVLCGTYYYGVFSPVSILAAIGINFFCAGQSQRATAAVYATCSLGYAALGGLTVARAIPDRGLARADGVPLFDCLMILTMVEVILLAVYLLARDMRRTSLEAIERHDEIVRSLAQRDALLREARHDLVEAMRAGGIGRYSGEVVGSFRLGSLIGRGGMGEVYEALQLDTSRPAAVKVITPELLGDREIVERFLREARITSSLSSAHVVRVLETSPADAPIPYLAMERLDGEDLAQSLRDKKPIDVARLVAMLEQVAVGLDAAHAAGVVHRDLKPRNLFCSRSPRGEEVWKILDFGVSKLVSGDATLTRGQMVGTPAYMAPEQARAQEVGPRADIFALGVIAYRALTGSPPFSGDNSVETLFRVSYAMPIRPSDIADLSAEIDLVLAIALAKDPKQRFATAAELAGAMHEAARGRIEAHLATRARALIAELPWGASSMDSLDAMG